jgi:hypothetical protein
VATAPAPTAAHGTTEPTARNFDATATPISPARKSTATMEKVAMGGRMGGIFVTASYVFRWIHNPW